MRTKDFLVLLTRLFLGYIFLSAGFCKITDGHFGQLIGPPWLEERLAEHGLGLFARVVALFQIFCGALLLSQRFSTLGAVMLIPMNIAILSVTISQQWQGTPYVNAVFLLLNVLVLLYERKKFAFLIHQPSPTAEPVPLDMLRVNRYDLPALCIIFVSALIAPYNYNLVAFTVSAAFLVFALPLITSDQLHRVETILVGQSFANMLMATLAAGYEIIPTIMSANTLLIVVILIVWVVTGRKRKKHKIAVA